MLLNPEKKQAILSCKQEPKDKLVLRLQPGGKVRVNMLNLLSGAAPTFSDNFVELSYEELEEALHQLKEMQ